MRFFSGSRNGDKKKGFASEQYKKGLNAKPGPEMTADEKYKLMLDKKMSQILDDIAMGKRKGFKIPGTKEADTPKEMSKNYKAMLETLARQKADKEMKKQKKKQQAWELEQKQKKRAEEKKKNDEITLREVQAQQQQQAGSYFFGSAPTDKNNGWW